MTKLFLCIALFIHTKNFALDLQKSLLDQLDDVDNYLPDDNNNLPEAQGLVESIHTIAERLCNEVIQPRKIQSSHLYTLAKNKKLPKSPEKMKIQLQQAIQCYQDEYDEAKQTGADTDTLTQVQGKIDSAKKDFQAVCCYNNYLALLKKTYPEYTPAKEDDVDKNEEPLKSLLKKLFGGSTGS